VMTLPFQNTLKWFSIKRQFLLLRPWKWALVAEASVENADLIYEFGLNLGLAFQLQDDYLDAFVTLKLWKASRRWYNWE
jgi:hypothetical protein